MTSTLVHDPLGATVVGARLQDIGSADVGELTGLLATHGVAVFPGQDVDDREFRDFLRLFGELAFTAGETPVDGCAELNLISNVGRREPPRSTFHVDTSYVRTPPAYTALRAVRVPDDGGATLFTNQYRAYDTLDPELRARLEGRTITHVVTGVELGEDDETEAVHPVFRAHPLSGRTALYLTAPARCRAVSGMSTDEGDSTVRVLFDHSTRPDNTFVHRWNVGDVVMWDNGCVLHRADHSGVVGDRVMHRGMVADYPRR